MPLDATTVHGQIAGKDYWDEDLEEHFVTGGKSSATRIIVCKWDDRVPIVTALSGGSTQTGIITTNTPPLSYPDAPWMIVKGVHPSGVGKRKTGVNNMVGYDFARLRIEYGVPDRDLGQLQDLGALSMDISNEIISPPSEPGSPPSFQWGADASDASIQNQPISNEVTTGFSLSTATWERVRKNLASIPIPLIISLLDHVNETPFEGAPKGHVIFKGARPQWRYTNLGNQNLDLSLAFVYRTVPWNSFFCPDTGQFEPVVTIGTGKPFFPYGDLSKLYL
jgi:hypothetical protein